jgi:hypothetical protein
MFAIWSGSVGDVEIRKMNRAPSLRKEWAMFEEVRIFNAKGTLKKIVKTKESSKRFWDQYYASQGKQNSRIEIKPKRRPRINPFEFPEEASNNWNDY